MDVQNIKKKKSLKYVSTAPSRVFAVVPVCQQQRPDGTDRHPQERRGRV